MKKFLLALLFILLSAPVLAGEPPMAGSDAPSFQSAGSEWRLA